MKNRLAMAIGSLLALVLICGFGYFLHLLIASDNQTRIAVVTAMVTVGTLVYTQTLTSKREIAARQFAKKAEAYEEVMATIAGLMKASHKGEEVDETALVDSLSAIVPKLTVWAGPEVLQAWILMSTPTDKPLGGLVAGSTLITALRKELGHENDSVLGPLGALSAMMKRDENGNII